MNSMSDKTAMNTDREIWRLRPDDYYSPSIHVTESGGIGMNIGGFVIVKPVEWWYGLAKAAVTQAAPVSPLPKESRSIREITTLEKARMPSVETQAGGEAEQSVRSIPEAPSARYREPDSVKDGYSPSPNMLSQTAPVSRCTKNPAECGNLWCKTTKECWEAAPVSLEITAELATPQTPAELERVRAEARAAGFNVAAPVSPRPKSAQEFWQSLPLICPENARPANFPFAEAYAKYFADSVSLTPSSKEKI